MSTEKLEYMHYFRAFTMIFIVAGHCIDIFKWNDMVSLERSFRIAVGNGSVLFVFIAGYLFQHLLPKFNYDKYLLKKAKNVVLPYFFCSIPAIIIFVFFIQREGLAIDFYEKSVIEQSVIFLLTGSHLAPYWFIPMIVIFYIFAPVFRFCDQNVYIYYLLPVLLFVSCLTDRGAPYESFVHFISVYILGMFCSRFHGALNPIISQSTCLFFLGMSVVLLAVAEFHLMKGTMTWVNFIQKAAMSILVLGVFIRFSNKIKCSLLSTVADYSFGIFFIHSYVISAGKVIIIMFFGSLADFYFSSYLISVLLTLSICMLIVFFVKSAFQNKSRLLVGS